MKKIKSVWEENKVLMVLAIILVVCIVVFVIVGMTYFYGSSNNVYGNRLDVTKNVPLSDKLLKDIEDDLKSKNGVTSANASVKGLIVYVDAKFTNETTMETAEGIVETILPLFNEDELATYDIEITISSDGDNGFTLMGARNASGSGIIIWNNYNIQEESSAE